MKTLDILDLVNVSGGATSRSSNNDLVTQQLTQLTASIKDVANTNNKGGDQTFLFLAMAMMMNRPQGGPTVVAAGGAPVAGGPVVNIATRVRHW